MKIIIQKQWYVLGITVLLLQSCNLYGITLVYNMKIRRAFDTKAFIESRPKTIALFTALPLFYKRDRHIVIPSLHQDINENLLALGAIFNIRVITPKYWWAELTTGVENQSVTSTGTNPFKLSGTGMDDIIISAGRNFILKDNNQVAIYGLAGFPTKTKVTVAETQTNLTGSRFFGLGIGMELSHAFMEKIGRSVVGVLQTRFVHFFKRSWYPIFPRDARIRPGNITDIFVILQYNEKMNVFEVGYNPTFFTHQGALFQAGTERGPNIVRNSFYTNYMYLFRESYVVKMPGAVGVGLNIGRSSLFNTKIVSGWFNLTVLF